MLPLMDREATLAELQWQSGAELAPPPWPMFVAAAVSGMQALLSGEPADLAGVPLDWAGIGHFEQKVYEAARRLLPGHTSTYDELAQVMGNPGAARAVDVALSRNPWLLLVPCHRVLAGHGRLGSYSAPGGAGTKRRCWTSKRWGCTARRRWRRRQRRPPHLPATCAGTSPATFAGIFTECGAARRPTAPARRCPGSPPPPARCP
ncbi:MAG: methylated-DNA--[protein]-cysteine S-methyltransferase [Rubrivivax sp.]